jgi:hypothetical protein
VEALQDEADSTVASLPAARAALPRAVPCHLEQAWPMPRLPRRSSLMEEERDTASVILISI